MINTPPKPGVLHVASGASGTINVHADSAGRLWIELPARLARFCGGAGDSALRGALLGAAGAAGLKTTAKVAGPSSIGNYLAGLGIPATAGFGVDYRGLHGTDERIRLESVPQVQAVYHRALLTLLHAS
jgi:hypothetical protein